MHTDVILVSGDKVTKQFAEKKGKVYILEVKRSFERSASVSSFVLAVYFVLAGSAYSFQYVVDAVQRKVFGKGHDRYVHLFQTERAVAYFAIEMRVQVVDRTHAPVAANGVFQRSRSVVDGVDQMMRQKEIDRTENRGFIDRVQFRFEIGKGECPFHSDHGVQHQ